MTFGAVPTTRHARGSNRASLPCWGRAWVFGLRSPITALGDDVLGQPLGMTFGAVFGDDVWGSLRGWRGGSPHYPASRVQGATLGPQMLKAKCGLLPEMPMSLLQVMGKRFSVFGGGYFRLAPKNIIELGIQRLNSVENRGYDGLV